mgnify:CR=1 FL=1
MVSSIYVLVSVAINLLIQASEILVVLYIAGGVLGLISAWQFRRLSRRSKVWVTLPSAAAIALGFAGTLWLFILGLKVRGIVGPAWLIFIVNAWELWRERSRI